MLAIEAFQVVFNAGNGIGQGIQPIPFGGDLSLKQLLFHKPCTGANNPGRPGQGNHVQTAANFAQGHRYRLKVRAIPLRGNVLDNGILGLLQATA